MLKIEKIKEEIKNFDTDRDSMSCYLAQMATKSVDIDGCSRKDTSCDECLKLSLEELLEEYKGPVKITHFEY